MKIKRYFAPDMRQAIRMVRDAQGPDAVILSNKKVDGGVEIVAAMDYDEAMVEQMGQQEPAIRAPEPVPRDSLVQAPSPGPEPAPRLERTPVNPDPAPVTWSQEPTLVAMREEMKTLRSMLEGQLSSLAWSDESRNNPLHAELLERFLRLGIAPDLARVLARQVELGDDVEYNWRQALGYLARSIEVTHDDILNDGGTVALVGSTGVGKTTTIAKLAARYTLRHGPNRVALITTDNYRIGAQQQLKTFGRILGTPVHTARSGEELRQQLQHLQQKSLVLIDTAGMSQHDMRLSEQFSVLREGGTRIKPYLVLSAPTQRHALEETVRAFGHLDLAGTILTKVDEAASLGDSLSAIIRQRLPLAYVSDGQRVPEDLNPARANKLVSLAVSLMQRHSEQLDEQWVAQTFGTRVSNLHA